MNEYNLAYFKGEVKKFYHVYQFLCDEVLNDGKKENVSYPVLQVICMLLQNMGFSGVGCLNYDHERAVKEVETKLEALKRINEYHKGEYLTHYAYNEISLLYMGLTMNEAESLESDYFNG